MKEIGVLQAYIRRVGPTVVELCAGDRALARSVFIERVIGSLLRDTPRLRDRAGLRGELARHVFGYDSEQLSGDLYEQCCKALSELPGCLSEDTRMVAWAYQLWNEPIRDGTSWAISKRSLGQSESAQVAVLTQLFTDDYIADFLVQRCLELVGERVPDEGLVPLLCDPACGGGSILLSALRCLVRRGVPVDRLVGMLWGFDIDPDVVAVARVLVFVEMMRLGYQGDPVALWSSVQNSIREVSAPFGLLDRAALGTATPAQFDLVITNPPYLGRRKLSSRMRSFLDTEYPAANVDLCAACMQRCVELTREGGVVGLLTTDKWLRLGGYEPLRTGGGGFGGLLNALTLDVVVELGERAFHPSAALHDGVKASILCGHKRSPEARHSFSFISLTRISNYLDKQVALRACGDSAERERVGARINQTQFREGGAGTALLAVSGLPSGLCSSTKTVGDYADVIVGIQTNDDQAFVRYVWEVSPLDPQWRLHSKGGGYSRWAGFNRWVIRWGDKSPDFFRTESALEKAQAWVSKEGWCYTWFANGNLGVRVKPTGCSFGRAASSGIFCSDRRLIAFLNSRFASLASRALGGKIQLPEGVVRRLPAPRSLDGISLKLVDLVVELKRELLRSDITDVLFDPTVAYSWSETLALECLRLVVEGLLEAQVERALGMSRDDGELCGVSMGVPVGWFRMQQSFASHPFWEALPQSLAEVRGSILEAARDIPCVIPNSCESPSAIRPLSALKAKPSRKYLLSADGSVEQLARFFELHPFDLFVSMRHFAVMHEEWRRWALLPVVQTEILRNVLTLLGQQWWGAPAAWVHEPVALVNAEEVCAEASSVIDRCGAHGVTGPSLEEWLNRDWRLWQERAFLGSSPLDIRLDLRGRIECRHRWRAGGSHTSDKAHPAAYA